MYEVGKNEMWIGKEIGLNEILKKLGKKNLGIG